MQSLFTFSVVLGSNNTAVVSVAIQYFAFISGIYVFLFVEVWVEQRNCHC